MYAQAQAQAADGAGAGNGAAADDSTPEGEEEVVDAEVVDGEESR